MVSMPNYIIHNLKTANNTNQLIDTNALITALDTIEEDGIMDSLLKRNRVNDNKWCNFTTKRQLNP